MPKPELFSPGARPEWVQTIKLPVSKTRTSETYAIDSAFPDRAWGLLGTMIEGNRSWEPVLTWIGENLIPRYPDQYFPRTVYDSPARAFQYPPFAPWNAKPDDLFRVISVFPPSEAQYAFLRHYLFHPDLNIRASAGHAVINRLNKYPENWTRDFWTIVRSDPSDYSLLLSWMEQDYNYWQNSQKNRLSVFINGTIFAQPEITQSYFPDEVKKYFNIDTAKPFKPQEFFRKLFYEDQIRKIQELLGATQRKINGTGSDNSIDDIIKRSQISPDYPTVDTMVPYLIGLDDDKIAIGLLHLIVLPEWYALFQTQPDLENVKSLGVRLSTFIRDPNKRAAFFTVIMILLDSQLSSQTAVALAQSDYIFHPDIIVTEIMPYFEKNRQANPETAKAILESLALSVFRDYSGHNLPRFGNKRLSFW